MDRGHERDAMHHATDLDAHSERQNPAEDMVQLCCSTAIHAKLMPVQQALSPAERDSLKMAALLLVGAIRAAAPHPLVAYFLW